MFKGLVRDRHLQAEGKWDVVAGGRTSHGAGCNVQDIGGPLAKASTPLSRKREEDCCGSESPRRFGCLRDPKGSVAPLSLLFIVIFLAIQAHFGSFTRAAVDCG